MRELNTKEIAAVSGASLSSVGSFLGYQTGNIADALASLVGLSTNFGSYTSQIGTGIGQLVSLNVSNGLSNITNGCTGLTNAVMTAIGNIFSKQK